MKKIKILPNWVYTGKLSESLRQKTLNHLENEEWDLNKVNLITKDKFLHRKDSYTELTQYLSGELQKIHEDLALQCEKLSIVLMWGNKATVSQWHHTHNHKRAWASGIVYLSPSNSKTWFSSSNFWDKTDLLAVYQDEVDNQLYYKHPSTPGEYIIFPSTLLHSVDEHELEFPRYSIAFNVFPSGKMGALDGASYLNLSFNYD